MNNKFYIGKKVSSFESYNDVGPITGVSLVVDAENEYRAGDDSGVRLEVECPYGSQMMADNILASIQGRTYKGFRAGDAELDMTAELGDGITVNGVYSMLAYRNLTFGPGHMSEVAAPGESELEHEYPYISTTQKEINRKTAETRSLISKTAEEIRLEVSATDGRVSALSVTLDGVTIKDESGQTLIKGSSIDTTTIKANSITADKLNMTGSISFGDLDANMQNTVNQTAINASNAMLQSSTAVNQVTAWTYPGSTYIDGSKLMTGTVMASKLLGGYVGLLDSNENTVGQIAIGASSISSYAIELNSTSGGLRLSSAAAFWVDSAYGSMGIGSAGAVFSVPVVPRDSGLISLGTSGAMWSQLYATTATINTSDRRKKNTITYDMSRYDALFDLLKPCFFKMNDGESGRFHIGMIAQDIEEALSKAGLTSADFAGFIKSRLDNGEYGYGLRYSEFVALNTWEIQKLKARVAKLEGKAS